MTTQVTAAGITVAQAATAGGKKININSFQIWPDIVKPIPGDPTTDIPNSVFIGGPSQLQYAVVDSNTVEYIVTLDESIGNFLVGRIGLYSDNGDGTATLFSITAVDAPYPDYKFKTLGNQVGDRLTFAIYLTISNLPKISVFTVPLLPQLSVPFSPDEISLPDPLHVVFNTSQVTRHSVARVPALAYRETLTQGRDIPAWLMRPERLIPGQGEGIIPIAETSFDASATVGTVVALDDVNKMVTKGEPAANQYILGIRSSAEEITNYGIYVDPVNSYSPGQKLYVGTAGISGTPSTLGKLTTIANNWPIGFAMGPASTTNATGYLCWIDFTTLWGTSGQNGPPGPPGPKGPPGDDGVSGTSANLFTPGCYLKKIGPNLVLIPYNGDLIVINQVLQQIPYNGVALAPTGLSINTLYYIYAFMSGTTMILEASTAGHMTSTIDGIEIKNGDQTRTLVGVAYTIAGPAWADVAPSAQAPGSGNAIASGYNVGQLYVLSWFNPRSKSVTTWLKGTLNYMAGVSLSSSNFVEVSPGDLRNYFLTWANREVRYTTGGQVLIPSPHGVGTAIQFDGTGYEKYGTGAHQQSVGGVNLNMQPGVQGIRQGLSEGQHFGTLLGVVLGADSRARATYRLGIGGNGPVMDAPVSLTITVDG